MIGFNFLKRFLIGSYFIDACFQYKMQQKKQVDFANLLNRDVALKIFSFLKAEDLAKSRRLNKKYKVLASDEALWKAQYPKIAFGKKQWAKYFGDIGKEPPLPYDIHKILKSPCPFFSGKIVEETHMLVLIPESINGKKLNLITLGELVKVPKEGHAAEYRDILNVIINSVGQQATNQSHWVLMTKDVIEGSRHMSYEAQQASIAEINRQTKMNYQVPTALEAAICIFMHYASSHERLFNDERRLSANQPLWIYTRCLEKIRGFIRDTDIHQVIVGGFSSEGLVIGLDHISSGFVGMAPLLRFF